jgi:hypothetical protein
MKKSTFLTPAIYLMILISSCQKDNSTVVHDTSSGKMNNPAFASITLCSSGTNPSLTIKNGLIGYYPFSGNANDISSYGNNGLPENFSFPSTNDSLAVLTTDKFGHPNSAYNFNGSNFIILNKNPLGNGAAPDSYGFSVKEFSIYLRFKTGTAGTLMYYGTRGVIVSKLIVNTNRSVTFDWEFITETGNTYNASVSGGPVCLDANRWVDVVLNFKNSCLILYLNGTLVGFQRTNFSAGTVIDNFRIGASLGTFPYDFFNGSMDEIRFYNRALTNPEIGYLVAH